MPHGDAAPFSALLDAAHAVAFHPLLPHLEHVGLAGPLPASLAAAQAFVGSVDPSRTLQWHPTWDRVDLVVRFTPGRPNDLPTLFLPDRLPARVQSAAVRAGGVDGERRINYALAFLSPGDRLLLTPLHSTDEAFLLEVIAQLPDQDVRVGPWDPTADLLVEDTWRVSERATLVV